MIINKRGEQTILNDKYKQYIEKAIINNENTIQTNITNKVNLSKDTNVIKIILNNDLIDSSEDFAGLTNIIKKDLSNFNCLKITNIEKMFDGCVH